MINIWAGLAYDLDGVRRLNHDAMLERCHVSTCLHKLAFVGELGPWFCNLASFPSPNRGFQEETRCVLWIGWHIYCLKLFIYLQLSAGRADAVEWAKEGAMGHILYIAHSRDLKQSYA